MPTGRGDDRAVKGPIQFVGGQLAGWMASLLVAASVLLPAGQAHGYMDTAPRSQVSRARADMCSVATALEAYRVDHDAFPPAQTEDLLPVRMLTTPVGYLSAGGSDSFKTRIFVPKRPPVVPPGLKRFLLGSLAAALLYGTLRLFIDPICPRVPSRTIARDVIVIAVVGGLLGYCTVIPSSKFTSVATPLPPGRSGAFDYWTDGMHVAVLRSIGVDGQPDAQGFSREELQRLLSPADDPTLTILAVQPDVVYDPTNGTISRGDLFWVVAPELSADRAVR